MQKPTQRPMKTTMPQMVRRSPVRGFLARANPMGTTTVAIKIERRRYFAIVSRLRTYLTGPLRAAMPASNPARRARVARPPFPLSGSLLL